MSNCKTILLLSGNTTAIIDKNNCVHILDTYDCDSVLLTPTDIVKLALGLGARFWEALVEVQAEKS